MLQRSALACADRRDSNLFRSEAVFTGDPDLSDPRLFRHQLQLAPVGDFEPVGRVKVQGSFEFGQRRGAEFQARPAGLSASTTARTGSCEPAWLLIII